MRKKENIFKPTLRVQVIGKRCQITLEKKLRR